MNLKRVVVTGLGSLTPLGNDTASTWRSMLTGVSGASPITRFDTTNFKCKIACEVKGFNPLDYFDRKEVKKLDLFTQYGLVASEEAILDSGILNYPIDKTRIGVIWGSGNGGVTSFQEEMREYVRGNDIPRFSPFFCTRMIANICAGQISIKHGFRGPNYCTVAACASSAAAIADAFNLVRLGKADAIVAGGSEAAVVECSIGGFGSMQALSCRNDDPLTASRPFDRDRDGFVLGEGAGALILEDLEHAQRRGAKIYAELTGCGFSSDAYHVTASHPDGLGAMLAMQEAVRESEMPLEAVEHINMHGTSTPIGDISEPHAIAKLFCEHAPTISLTSTKSMTGHLLGAAGSVEAIATIMALNDGIIPPTINHFNDDPNIAPLHFVFNKAERRDIHFALSNSFGFGGHNISLAFRSMEGA